MSRPRKGTFVRGLEPEYIEELKKVTEQEDAATAIERATRQSEFVARNRKWLGRLQRIEKVDPALFSRLVLIYEKLLSPFESFIQDVDDILVNDYPQYFPRNQEGES